MEALNLIERIYVLIAGLIAGVIDAIAGGGGLITLPVLTQVLGPGADAIATNKMMGFATATAAYWVYRRHQRNKKNSLQTKARGPYFFFLFLGSLLGSWFTPILPKEVFRYILLVACPLILILVWRRSSLVKEIQVATTKRTLALSAVGFVSGFYDGFFGPGGGTLMLLGLIWGAGLPLIEALLVSKLANSFSAGVALLSYAQQGLVHFDAGLLIATGGTIGGWIGARLASKRAENIVKPVLTVVVILLMIQQIFAILSD